MEMIYANNTHFHKKSDALGLILKVRAFGTRKWPITVCFARVGTHANVRQVESLIRDFSNAGRHEHSFISATGIKSRTDLAQTAGTIEEIETRWTRACVHQHFCGRLI